MPRLYTASAMSFIFKVNVKMPNHATVKFICLLRNIFISTEIIPTMPTYIQ